MKHFILTAMALLCLSCNAKSEVIQLSHEVGDCDPNVVPEISYIHFDLSKVLEFIYDRAEDRYYISYSDADMFDSDYVAEMEELGYEEWSFYYMVLQISKEDFFELLEDSNRPTEEQLALIRYEKYLIKEVITPVEGGVNYQYYLVKNPSHE